MATYTRSLACRPMFDEIERVGSTTYSVDEITPTSQLEWSVWNVFASPTLETAENDGSDVSDIQGDGSGVDECVEGCR